MLDRSSKYALAATVPLALTSILEMGRVVLDRPWRGIADWNSDAISITLTCICVATAAALLLRRRRPILARIACVLAIVAPFAMFAHACVTRVLGNPIGMLYAVVAALTALCTKRALDGSEYARLVFPQTHAPHPSPG
jgi:hypothetical protein